MYRLKAVLEHNRQGFHFVTLTLSFVSILGASLFENTTLHRGNNVQHYRTVLGVVKSLFVDKRT